MDTGTRDQVDELTSLAHARARAEAAEWAAMARFRDHEFTRTAATACPRRRAVERSTIALEIGQATCLSETQVRNRLAVIDTVNERVPRVWAAFSNGVISAPQVTEISRAASQLERPTSWARLQDRVIDYAATHHLSELRRWLRSFVRRTEPDLVGQRAEVEHSHRHVSLTHLDDGMAWFSAYLPSHTAAAVDARLTAIAAMLPPDDERTLAQRRADLLVAAVLHECADSPTGAPTPRTDIAVVVNTETLVGLVPGLAEAADASWAVPAHWVTELLASGTAFWHRLLIDPFTSNVLAHDYVGRFAPAVLATALRFAHGTCTAPGCLVPAERCDIDHLTPWPHGPTHADNLHPLCRRHHQHKSHGTLRWRLPSGLEPRPD